MNDPRYPIGKFNYEGDPSVEQRRKLIEDIAQTPAALRAVVKGLSLEQIETPYRPGGWTVRQVVHHVPESHMNSYIRCKLALTEDKQTIKPYDEARWAELPDIHATPIEVSLTLLEALHQRWTHLLRSLAEADFSREFNHPAIGIVSLDRNLSLYAWHGAHHVAHITALRDRMGWR